MNTKTTASKAPRVLVVDDMPDNLFLMNGLLEDRFDVLQASDGRSAIDAVMSATPPDVVLLDIMMPGMDGYEVLRRIRQHPPTANIPVIFITALSSRQDVNLGRELGAVDYLTKPIDPELVLRRVEGHVRHAVHARRIDELSEKLARRLAPVSWRALFQGAAIERIRFESKRQTVLYVEFAQADALTSMDHDAFTEEVEWLAARHAGTVDRFFVGAAVVFFDEPADCWRMAMELHHAASELKIRMGIRTGECDIGIFRTEGNECCTLIGQETRLVGSVASTAAVGSIAISAETYLLARDEMQSVLAGCTVAPEYEGLELDKVTVTPMREAKQSRNAELSGQSSAAGHC